MILSAALALIAPWIAAALVGVIGGRAPGAGKVAVGITGIGFLAAAVFGVATLGAPAAVVGGGALTVMLDGLAGVMTLLVLGLSAVIQSFALRYLRGDPRQRWFVITANLLTGSTLVLVCAGSVVLFVVGWLAAGASLVLLLNTYAHEHQARDGVRRTARRFAIADAGLVAAAAVLVAAGGPGVALAEVGDVVTTLPGALGLAVGLLLVLPALARSSQLPFHGWLPATLAAPTPVSALLHAGVINAGAILLIRFSPGIAGSTAVMAVVFAAGAATLVYASAVRLTKPDVKGRLVFSTMAQMGFMMMACGLGAYAAAVFHLVAHGLYKSALFLSAGSGVNRAARRRMWPARRPTTLAHRASALLIAVLVPGAALLAARSLIAPQIPPASAALLAFVALAGAVTLGAALLVRISVATVLGSAFGIGVLALAYTALLTFFDTLLGPIPAVGAVSAWWVLAPAVGLVLTQWLARPGASFVRDALYVRSLSAGAPALARRQGI